MLKTIAAHLTLAALIIVAIASMPAINAKADSYGYGYRYHGGQQSYDYYYGHH